jgi:glycerol-3-phosphate acyltransferase PlsY
MNTTLLFPTLLLSSCFIGSIIFGPIISKLFKLPDPRSQGSKNPGATNVFRTNKLAGLLTFLCDGLKGWIVVFISDYFFRLPIDQLSWIGLAVVLGHLFPIFSGFKHGGKGVATFIGAVIGLAPLVGLIWIITWLTVAFITRYSSLAALIATIFSVFEFYFVAHFLVMDCLPIAIIAVFILWRHRANIQRLLAGTESRIGR